MLDEAPNPSLSAQPEESSMKMNRSVVAGARCAAAVAGMFALAALRAADYWPQFRGPNGAGIAESATPPTQFGPGKNLHWARARRRFVTDRLGRSSVSHRRDREGARHTGLRHAHRPRAVAALRRPRKAGDGAQVQLGRGIHSVHGRTARFRLFQFLRRRGLRFRGQGSLAASAADVASAVRCRQLARAGRRSTHRATRQPHGELAPPGTRREHRAHALGRRAAAGAR